MLDILETKRDEILFDIEAVNKNLEQLENEHAELVKQLHELKGAQRVVLSLIEQAGHNPLDKLCAAARVEGAPLGAGTYEEIMMGRYAAPSLEELLKPSPKPFVKGARVRVKEDVLEYKGREGVVVILDQDLFSIGVHIVGDEEGVITFFKKEELEHV